MDLMVFICRVKIVLVFDAAEYRIERDWMLFPKQYLVSNAAAA